MPSIDLILKDLTAFDRMSGPVSFWDKNELCRYANAACYEWCGKKPEEIVNKIYLKTLLGDKNYEANYNLIQSSLEGTKQNFDLEFTPSGSHVREFSVELMPYNSNNVTVGFFLHVTDITEIKNFNIEESPLGRLDDLFKNLIENTPTPAFVVDSEHVVRYLNGAYRKLKPYVNVGNSILKSFPPEIAESYVATYRKIFASRQINSATEKVLDSDGNEKVFKIVRFPLSYQNKSMVGGFAIDITDQLPMIKHA
jgi:PAS domain S-box-containing protein